MKVAWSGSGTIQAKRLRVYKANVSQVSGNLADCGYLHTFHD